MDSPHTARAAASSDQLLAFVQYLRGKKIPVSPADTLDAIEVAELVGYQNRSLLKNGLAAALAKSRHELTVFESASPPDLAAGVLRIFNPSQSARPRAVSPMFRPRGLQQSRPSSRPRPSRQRRARIHWKGCVAIHCLTPSNRRTKARCPWPLRRLRELRGTLLMMLQTGRRVRVPCWLLLRALGVGVFPGVGPRWGRRC